MNLKHYSTFSNYQISLLKLLTKTITDKICWNLGKYMHYGTKILQLCFNQNTCKVPGSGSSSLSTVPEVSSSQCFHSLGNKSFEGLAPASISFKLSSPFSKIALDCEYHEIIFQGGTLTAWLFTIKETTGFRMSNILHKSMTKSCPRTYSK